MKTRIINELARIASEKYQYAYVLHGTKDEYAVPEQMIDTVRGTISTVMANPTISSSLSDSQVEALKRFDGVAAAAYAQLPWHSVTTSRMILKRPEWQKLREAAAMCLRDFSVDVQEWESRIKGHSRI